MPDVRKRRRSLADYCQYVKGVGPVRAERLKKLGVETIDDLLTHFPRKYYDRRNLSKIGQLVPGEEASFLGQLLSVAQRGGRRRRSCITAALGDDTGVVQVVWFNQPYLARHLKPGGELIVTGELGYFRGSRQLVNPEFEIISEALDQELLHTGRIVPVYPLTSGITQRFLRALIARTLEQYHDAVHENLPAAVMKSAGVPGRLDALRAIHFPDDPKQHEQAVARLKLEELFFMQLLFSLQRRRSLNRSDRPRIDIPFELADEAIASLPFELTGAQQRVIADIRADLSGSGTNRLLQGDVGSGKT